jgi:hypothetical protein
MTGSLPPHVQADVQRILDRAARRLLIEQLDRDAVATATRSDAHALNGGADQGAPLIERELVPIRRRADSHDGPLAA